MDGRRWVLKSEARNFFLCAAGEDPRAALWVFGSKDAAEDHLENLTEPKMYLDTLERYGTEMPAWMNEDPLLPEPREVSSEDLRNILDATGIRYVAMSSEDEPDTLEVFSAEEFDFLFLDEEGE
ncbi:MAG: hypothetical protein H0U65_00960 [Rubrobacter sp.]|nr:hypothetical protein [Rubrobacter sp.]